MLHNKTYFLICNLNLFNFQIFIFAKVENALILLFITNTEGCGATHIEALGRWVRCGRK